MPMVPSGVVNQALIASVIENAAQALAPEVVKIRHTLDIDSTGAPAIFFRVLLSDQASQLDKLYVTAESVTNKLLELLQPQEQFGLEAYFNFRSVSEQAKLKDPNWI